MSGTAARPVPVLRVALVEGERSPLAVRDVTPAGRGLLTVEDHVFGGVRVASHAQAG